MYYLSSSPILSNLKNKIKNIITLVKSAHFQERMKQITLPGFEGIPLYDVAKKFREEIKQDAIAVRASSMSYFFILAIFPSIIFFFSLIPYIPITNFNVVLMQYLSEIMPSGVFNVLESTIVDIVSVQRGGLTSVNLFLAFIFSSSGVSSMLQAFEKINPTFRKRTFLQKRWISIKITFLLSTQLVTAIALVILGQETLKTILLYFNITSSFTLYLFLALKYLCVIFIFFNSVALIYYYGPAVKERHRFFSIGATTTTVIMIFLSYVLSLYFSLFHNFNQFYGSLGIILVIMIWVNINAMVILIGFELNNSIAVNKVMRKESFDKKNE